tara:strand:- start:867 stop:1625 length:759 start_codon:yes stop_codon:yes gene_type:complete
LLFSCAPKKAQIDFADLQNELNKKFTHGKKLFDKKKYARAKDDFDYIILNDRGSEIGKEARYYQAESLFKLKQYSDAISSYERFLQYSDDEIKNEYCRFRVCECYYNISNKHDRDQSNNDIALETLQMFIDDFSDSDFLDLAEDFILDLRLRKAEKLHETGRLYLKEKEFDSAIIYFNNVIDNYYDTIYSDEARISIIFLYLLKEENQKANLYFDNNKDKFIDIEKQMEAEKLLNKFHSSGSWFSNMIRLYK